MFFRVYQLGFGLEKRRELNIDILNGTKTFRDAFKEMLDSVCQAGHSFDQVVEYLRKGLRLTSHSLSRVCRI